MHKKMNLRQTQTIPEPKRSAVTEFPLLVSAVLAGAILLAGYDVRSQTAPGLAITHTGTNQVSIIITNAVLTDSYELWWTPVLGDTADYPWAAAAVGNIGQTNFILPNWEYPGVFFRGLLDTNTVPLWEAANPNNATNVLKVTIFSPANGAVLQ